MPSPHYPSRPSLAEPNTLAKYFVQHYPTESKSLIPAVTYMYGLEALLLLCVWGGGGRGILLRVHSVLFQNLLFFLPPPLRPLCPYLLQDTIARHNRISRFTYIAGDPAATLATEVILITTVEKFNSVHSAGWLNFKPSAFASPVRKEKTEPAHEGSNDDRLFSRLDLTAWWCLGYLLLSVECREDGEMQCAFFIWIFPRSSLYIATGRNNAETTQFVLAWSMDPSILEFFPFPRPPSSALLPSLLFCRKRKQGSFNDLYWTTGDGGPQTDPNGASQDLTNLLGAMVRISVPTTAGYVNPSTGLPYDIPSGNYQGTCVCKQRLCIDELFSQ